MKQFILLSLLIIYTNSQLLYEYDVPVCDSSPWPMFRRNRLNNGRQTVLENITSNSSEPWSYQTGAGIFSSPVIGCHEEILVGSADRYFYSLNAITGTLNWKFLTNGIIDSAGCATDQNSIAFPSGDGNVYLLNQSDGSVIWKFGSHCEAGSADASQGKHCSIIPAVGGSSNWFEGNVAVTAQGRLYAGADDYRLYGFNMLTGQEEMNIYAGPIPYGAVWSMITSQLNGNIFFASMTFSVYGFDINGNCLWSKLVGGSISSSPAQSDDGSVIYIGAWNGIMYAINSKNGDTIWEFQTSDLIYSSPAVDENGNIYFSGVDGKIYALNSQGKLIWSYETLYPMDSSVSLLVPRQELYVGGGNARIFCLDYVTGKLKWSFITLSSEDANENMNVNSSPALGLDRVVVGTSSGMIWSVPYTYCETNIQNDWRCEKDSPLSDGEHLLYMSTQGNQYLPAQTEAFQVNKGSVFAFRLLVKQNQSVVNANFVYNKISVTLSSDAPTSVSFDIVIQKGGGSYIFNAIPNGFLPDSFSLSINAYYQYNYIGQEYQIQKTFNFTSSPSTQIINQEESESVPAIIMQNLNLYQPAFYVSINQIGFQSFVMIHSQILQQFNQTLYFSLGGQFSKSQIGYEIDPQTCTIFPALAANQENQLIMEAADVSVITGGPLMYYDSYRYSGSLQQDQQGLLSFDSRTSSATLKTSCLTLASVSAMFLYYDLCDSNLNFFTTGSLDSLPYTGTANVKPNNIQITSSSYSDWIVSKYVTVEISTIFGTYLRSEHIVSIIMYNIDEDNQTISLVEMDYYKNLKITTDSNGNINKITLDIPLTVSISSGKTHYVVMTDLYPFQDKTISSIF